MKFERIHIIVSLAIAALVWWITLVLQGTPVTWAHATPFTTVAGFLGAFWLVFNRFLWRLPFLHGWFVKRPDLRGTWRVELQSSYIKPETKERVPVIVCYMGVKQTLSDLKMHLMTPESESWPIAGHIIPGGNGYRAVCVYENEPDLHLRNERISEKHEGALIIDTHGSGVRPDTLTAKYWTDRNTNGTMDFKRRVDKVFTRFEDADRHFEQS